MPKEASSSSAKAARHLLRDIAPRDLYKRLKSESRSSRTHTLTTDELVKLLDNARRHTDLPDVAATNAAEAAKQRQLELAQKRVETLERLHIAQTPDPTPTTSVTKQPLDDFKKTDLEDRTKILISKLDATIKRLGALKEIDNFEDRHDDKARKFCLGLKRLQALREHIDYIAPRLNLEEWKSVNWGLTTIGGISFKGLRRNYEHILSTVAGVCSDYFSCLDIEDLV